MVRALFFKLLLVSSHEKKGTGVLQGPFLKSIDLIREGTAVLSWDFTNASTSYCHQLWVLRFQHMELGAGDTNIQTTAIGLGIIINIMCRKDILEKS